VGTDTPAPRRVEQLETPVVVVDLDAVERNIRRMRGYCAEHAIDLRPHVKTHKVPWIAHMQSQGAVGIASQKLTEAEVMADAGIDQIRLTYPLVGEVKWARAARLAARTSLSVVGDSKVVAEGLSAALSPGCTIGFLVECDVGRWRTGVQSPEQALQLAQDVARLPNLSFMGLMTHPAPDASQAWFSAALELFADAGLELPVISVGGTPTAFETHRRVPVANELRVGTYVYGDRACLSNGVHELDDCALRVRATVVSRPTGRRMILDAGSKTLTNDLAEGVDDDLFGLILEYPEARLRQLSEEHGHAELPSASDRPAVGETVTIIPNHACAVTNLHDSVILHRAGLVNRQIDIAARGAVR
jgi:D-serine deaminase-like pyridoxal phosphate-dependent protein